MTLPFADQIGFRDVERQPVPETLGSRMNASPTGRQLGIDGSFVALLVDNDPNTTIESPPDGTVVMYDRAGTLEQWGFTRATGWQQL